MGLCEEEVLSLQEQVDKMKRSNARLERDNAALRARLADAEGERDALLAIDNSAGAFVRIRALRDAAEARATRAEEIAESRSRELDELNEKLMQEETRREIAEARVEKLERVREAAEEFKRRSRHFMSDLDGYRNAERNLAAALAECEEGRRG